MKAEGANGWVGKAVRDIYGRDLGRAVGLVFDLSGEVASIGIEEAGSFFEIRPDTVVSDEDVLEVMPEWKADAKKTGVHGASLEKRLAALAGMVERKEVSQEAYDSLHAKLMAVRGTHDQLTSRILARLDELEREVEAIDLFFTMVRLQFLAGEMGEESYIQTESRCKAIKEANAREALDVRKTVEEPQIGETSDVVLSKAMRAEPEPTTHVEEPGPMDATPELEHVEAVPEPIDEVEQPPLPMVANDSRKVSEAIEGPQTSAASGVDRVSELNGVNGGSGAIEDITFMPDPPELGTTKLTSLSALRNRPRPE